MTQPAIDTTLDLPAVSQDPSKPDVWGTLINNAITKVRDAVVSVLNLLNSKFDPASGLLVSGAVPFGTTSSTVARGSAANTALADALRVVVHGSATTTARPANPAPTLVMWVGTVAPANRTTRDLWVDEAASPAVLRRWDGTAWQPLSPPGAQGAKGDPGEVGPRGEPGPAGPGLYPLAAGEVAGSEPGGSLLVRTPNPVSAAGVASTNTFTRAGHGLLNNQAVVPTVAGPAPLAKNTPYYVVNRTTDTFQLSTSSGGAVLDVTEDGTLRYTRGFLQAV